MCWTLFFLILCAYYIWKWARGLPRVEGIHQKCVFITGCGSGFGNALARRLDVLGVPVFAGCRTEEAATRLKENTSERLQTVIVDVTSHESIVHAFEFVKNNLSGGKVLWGVVNNAGIAGYLGPLEYMTRKCFTDVYEVNLIGVMDVAQTFLPLLKQSEGRVVNTASVAGALQSRGAFPYVTSKHGVRAFSGGLAQEKKPYGIKVACILPGLFRTNIVAEDAIRKRVAEQWKSLPQDVKEEFGEKYRDDYLKMDLAFISKGPTDVTPVINDYEHALFSTHPRLEYFPGTDSVIFSYLSMLSPSWFCFVLENTLFRVIKLPVPKYLEEKAQRTSS